MVRCTLSFTASIVGALLCGVFLGGLELDAALPQGDVREFVHTSAAALLLNASAACPPVSACSEPSPTGTAAAAGAAATDAAAAAVAWRRALLWEQAQRALQTLPGYAPMRPAESAAAAAAPPAADSLLALVAAQTAPLDGGVGHRVRTRATWAALRAPADMHLVFVVSVLGLSPEGAEALTVEAAHEGDLLLLSGVPDSAHTKTEAQFAVVAALFGAVYRFHVKVDSDTFLLPRPYAAMLRALPPNATYYGGNEFQQGMYAWAADVSFMAGGGYFITPDVAAVFQRECGDCFTDAIAALAPSAVEGHCSRCIYHGDESEDIRIGRLIVRNAESLPRLERVRLNAYHCVGIGRYGGSGTRLISCLADEIMGKRTCNVPPLLSVHGVKEDAWWWIFAAHYRRLYDAGGSDALEAPFLNFVPGPFIWGSGFLLEDSPDFFSRL